MVAELGAMGGPPSHNSSREGHILVCITFIELKDCGVDSGYCGGSM